MSWKIEIHRAKPNPTGKDKIKNQPLVDQLLGEWVDLKNVGDTDVSLDTIYLAQTQYGPLCTPRSQPSIYWQGNYHDYLSPGDIVRVHTGKKANSVFMKHEDALNVSLHSFAEKGTFQLNNACGDCLSVLWKNKNLNWLKEDEASYDRNPPEGVILRRMGTKLVVPTPAQILYPYMK